MKLSLFIPVAAALTLAPCPRALAVSITAASTPDLAIPDNNLNGLADTITLSTTIDSISDVTVTLDIAGGWNGDYYAYLTHGTGFAVLLNRVGRTAANPDGSSDSGLQVTFRDAASGDIHWASAGSGGPLTGTYQPDGRKVDPLTALDTSTPRNAILGSFDGLDPNGAWTLFIADVSPLAIGKLESWSLTVDGKDPSPRVPEGGRTLSLGLMALIGLGGIKFAYRSAPRQELDSENVSERKAIH